MSERMRQNCCAVHTFVKAKLDFLFLQCLLSFISDVQHASAFSELFLILVYCVSDVTNS